MSYDIIFKHNVPLQKYTSFKTGGVARSFAEPKNIAELINVIKFFKNEHKIYILGNGSNILVKDGGIRGAVVRLAGDEFTKIERNGNFVFAGAGVSLPKLVKRTALCGLGGMEVLAGIPGTIGGAVMMNAGGNYGSICDVIYSVTTMTFDGEIIDYSRDKIDFAYRGCSLSKQVITKVVFELKESNTEKVLKKINEIYEEKKEKQPLATYNAGCIFKNPLPRKAAELIDKAGLKGTNVGDAIVSKKHANFIINKGNATSSEILELIEIIKRTIKEKFDVSLETEIQIW